MAMKSLVSFSMSVLFGGLAYVALSGNVSAAPIPNQSITGLAGLERQNSLVETVRHRRRGHNYGGGFSFYFGYPRYYSPRYYHPRQRYYGYRYPPRRYYGRGGGHSHVRWCRNRYRSYNPRTDQFLGYDGYYHYCNSPYR